MSIKYMNKHRGIHLSVLVFTLMVSGELFAQEKGLVNTSNSSHAQLSSVDMGDVQWTKGFWADRFQVCRETMVPNIFDQYKDPEVTHAFRNFEIAADLAEGKHKGPSFHDGDFYKVLEAVAATYAVTQDRELDRQMDEAIAVIAKAQQDNGYIYTPAIIEKKNNKGSGEAFQAKNFEAYNLGHLMTAACVHYRATGKSNFLDIAVKATDFLYNFYNEASPELARNAICPSHYMGIVEMYRTTRDHKYLVLVKNLIDLRGLSDDGTDDNQDRIPFREQTKAMGHAVRANYLYAGVADLYAETGDESLLETLNLMWDDVVYRKMYVTGACGSLYDGVSPDGTSYDPTDVQKIHQAYGRDYQLPNHTAHNETCANIGNVLWNYRMLQVTGEAKHADVMELALYNSVLSGISLNGTNFLYTNPLAYSDDLPFQQRWSKQRVPYISISNCCPPNVVRTVAEVSQYAYSISDKGLFFNLYGGSDLSTKLKDGSKVELSQQTEYPWDGNIRINLKKAPKKAFSLFLRIPEWTKNATLKVNGEAESIALQPGKYAELNRKWSAGDQIELILPMASRLMEANPLVEEARNQVAVKRGPVVYCMESVDLDKDNELTHFALSADAELLPKMIKIDNSDVMSLEGEALMVDKSNWENQLYREVSDRKPETAKIRMIPYYAWGNRGQTEMSVWIPLDR